MDMYNDVYWFLDIINFFFFLTLEALEVSNNSSIINFEDDLYIIIVNCVNSW